MHKKACLHDLDHFNGIFDLDSRIQAGPTQ